MHPFLCKLADICGRFHTNLFYFEASPIADVAAMTVSAVMFGLFMKNINKMLKEEGGKYEQCE